MNVSSYEGRRLIMFVLVYSSITYPLLTTSLRLPHQLRHHTRESAPTLIHTRAVRSRTYANVSVIPSHVMCSQIKNGHSLYTFLIE